MRPSASSTAPLPLAPFDTDHDHFVSVIEPDTEHGYQRRGTDNARPHSDATSSSEPEPDVLVGLLTPPPAAVPRPPPHTRHFSAHSHSQQSLNDEKSLHRTSWALTDGSHAAQTSESHPSKRPLLGRSHSSGVGGSDTVNSRMEEGIGGTVSRQQQRTLALMQADEFGGRRRGSRSSTWDEDAHRRRAKFQGFKAGLEIFIGRFLALFVEGKIVKEDILQRHGQLTAWSGISSAILCTPLLSTGVFFLLCWVPCHWLPSFSVLPLFSSSHSRHLRLLRS
jgi:hypothetical protein